MDSAQEEIIWVKMVSEKGKDGEPIHKVICVLPNRRPDGETIWMSQLTE
jgi:hypothetical protein